MKKVVERIIRLKNPHFRFGNDITLNEVLEISFTKFQSAIRSRKLLFRLRRPGKLFIGRQVKFFGLHNIKWGNWVQIGDQTVLSAYGKCRFLIGDNVSLGSMSRYIVTFSVSEPGKHIIIGNNVGIGDFCNLGGGGGVEIGDDCIIGAYFSCHPSNHNFDDPNQLIRLQGVTKKGIVIGKNCWIGAKVTILDGVIIGNNCVIAAGSVVTKSQPDNSVIAGVPAKIIRTTANISSQKGH